MLPCSCLLRTFVQFQNMLQRELWMNSTNPLTAHVKSCTAPNALHAMYGVVPRLHSLSPSVNLNCQLPVIPYQTMPRHTYQVPRVIISRPQQHQGGERIRLYITSNPQNKQVIPSTSLLHHTLRLPGRLRPPTSPMSTEKTTCTLNTRNHIQTVCSHKGEGTSYMEPK